MARVALDLETDIQPVSDFRANAATLIQRVRDSGRPLVLTQRGRGAAVVLDIGSYQRLLDEVEELRDVHQARQDVRAGRLIEHAEVVRQVGARSKK